MKTYEGDTKAGLKDKLKKHNINTNYSGIITKVFLPRLVIINHIVKTG